MNDALARLSAIRVRPDSATLDYAVEFERPLPEAALQKELDEERKTLRSDWLAARTPPGEIQDFEAQLRTERLQARKRSRITFSFDGPRFCYLQEPPKEGGRSAVAGRSLVYLNGKRTFWLFGRRPRVWEPKHWNSVEYVPIYGARMFDVPMFFQPSKLKFSESNKLPDTPYHADVLLPLSLPNGSCR